MGTMNNFSSGPQKKDSVLVRSSRDREPGTVFISTYGCQMNVNDTERMYALLEMSNYTPVDSPEKASLILINSCSIREKPVHKVYSEVGTFKKLKDQNPHLLIGVGGCVGQQEKDNLIKNSPLIDFVFGTDSIDMLPEIVARAADRDLAVRNLDRTERRKLPKVVESKFRHREPYHTETLVRNPGVSTFVNITKGCDNFCSFCVVPFTRGREKSRPLSHILSDVNQLVKRGVKEVTFLGQNVNSYKSDCGSDFADLLREVASQTDLRRIRYTTSHPKDFNQKLVETMASHPAKICDYIHLPFQSGNSHILEKMNRGYSREEYLEKIQMIKKAIPHVSLSTDIIVGFPGETEAQFQDTLSLVHEVGFETIFAFAYSPRPHTKAAQFTDQVDEDVKYERLNRLFDAHDRMAMDLVKKYENQTLKVLVEKEESPGSGKLTGRSSQNKLVHFMGSPDLIGQEVGVKITKAFPAVFRGELPQQQSLQ